jgi:hypothetical protein
MRNFKYKLLPIFFLVFAGCSKKQGSLIAPPPPPPSLLPPSPAPTFTPTFPKDAIVQINSIPSPLNINGEIPLVVWVNGKQLELNNYQLKAIASTLNTKEDEQQNTAELHSGKGWLEPLTKNQLK